MNIDRLHAINERYGMHVGDQAIKHVSERLRMRLPPPALAARLTGDRFALFLPDMSVPVARELVRQLSDALGRDGMTYENQRLALSISVGVAPVAKSKYPLSEALATAEAAFKLANERGRVRAADAAAAASHPPGEDVAFIGNVRDAIATERFRLEAQPIADLRSTATPRRYELLLRLTDERGHSMTPERFWSAAERCRLASEIDRWVVRYAFEILTPASEALAALGAHFTVNIAGQSLADETFLTFLEQTIREYSLPPAVLSFEIAESAVVANIVAAQRLAERLRELGFELALDDFGRGLSSTTYLERLPVAHLKIDGRLVRQLPANPRTQAMLRATVQLARTMSLHTTAECVESAELAARVREFGVDFAQGFAIGRPQPLEATLQTLLKAAAELRGVAPIALRSTGS